MSAEAMKWARAQSFGSMALKSMVNAIAARADPKGATWVSQRTLAQDVGASDRHVRELLAVLKQLGVVSRKARSAGRGLGRLTDVTTLPLHRAFRLTAKDVRKAREAIALALTSGTRLPVDDKIYNRNKSTLTSGTRVPGNTKRVTYPSQGEAISKVVVLDTDTRARDDALRPRLVVVNGRDGR